MPFFCRPLGVLGPPEILGFGSRPRGAHGFTLIELLLVIAIIGVLSSLVLPSLARARRQSHRAACLSNLHQLYLSLHSFAMENDDGVPLGYRGGRKQWNTMIYSGTNRKFVLFGRLFLADLMPTPRALYCPAERSPGQAYNTSENPWPPGQGSVSVQGGYGGLPSVDWGQEDLPARLPRWTDYSDRVLLSDTLSLPERVDSRHREGVNVTVGDGSARWVPRGVFQAPLQKCEGLSSANNDAQDEVWASLNLQR